MVGWAASVGRGQGKDTPEGKKLTTQWAAEGKTVLYVITEGKLLGAFAVEDEIRPESNDAVKELHRVGIRVAMITGDSKTVADSVAKRIGIDEVAAEVGGRVPLTTSREWGALAIGVVLFGITFLRQLQKFHPLPYVHPALISGLVGAMLIA